MRSVITLLIALGIGTTGASAQRSLLKPAPNGRRAEALPASTSGGPVLLAVREVSLEGQYPDGRPLKSGLLILFDPASHCFFWDLTLGWERHGEFRNGLLAAYASEDRLTVFHVLPGTNLMYVQDARDKAQSLDDAEASAIEAARGRLGTPQSRQWYGWREVSMAKVLDRDFFFPRDSVAPASPIEIVSVANREANWEVILKAQWKEKITLSDKYEVLKVARVP